MAAINDLLRLLGVTSDPVSPEDGDLWHRSDEAKLKLRRNGITEELAAISDIGGSLGDNSAIQGRRTTSFAIPVGTPANVLFDTTEVENDIATVEHYDTNLERVYLHESGMYLGGLNFEFLNIATQDRVVTMELWRNDSALLSSIDFAIDKSSTELVSRTLVIPPLPAGDYITIRLGADAVDVSLSTKAVVQVIRLSGKQGNVGPQGADGDMTWHGTWTSQNYTANQAVYYAPTGQSYVCHTNTVSFEVPTDVSFWDVLAEKGDTASLTVADEGVNLPNTPHTKVNYIGERLKAEDAGTGQFNVTVSETLDEYETQTTIAATAHDYNPTNWTTKRVHILSATGAQEVTGFVALPEGTERLLLVDGLDAIKLKHQNIGSAVANRIVGTNLSDQTALEGGSATIKYVAGVWRIIAAS